MPWPFAVASRPSAIALLPSPPAVPVSWPRVSRSVRREGAREAAAVAAAGGCASTICSTKFPELA